MSMGGGFASAAVDDIVNQYQYENDKWLTVKMHKNKYQSMAQDLEKAGINKLAMTGGIGGVGSPQMSSGTPPGQADPGTAIAQNKKLKIERDLADKEIQLKEQNTKTMNALEGKYLSETALTDNQRSAVFFQNAKLMSDWMTNNALQGKLNAERLKILLENVPLEVDKLIYKGKHGSEFRRMEKIKSFPQFMQLLSGSGNNLVDSLKDQFTREAIRRVTKQKKRVKTGVSAIKKGGKFVKKTSGKLYKKSGLKATIKRLKGWKKRPGTKWW